MRGRIGTLAALVAVLVAGCGGFGGAENASGDVSFLVFGEPEELKAYWSVITAFGTSSPTSP